MNRRLGFITSVIAILVPVLVYLRVWDYYAINIPKWDDHAFKQFLIDYLAADSFRDRWSALFRQHNEHRLVFTRLVALFDYRIFGRLNFKDLMFVANLLFLLVILLWWRILSRNGKPLYTLIPVAFIWPTLAHHENMYWGMASVQNFGVVTLAALAIYWSIRKHVGYYVLGLVTLFIAVFTSPNGLLVLPIVVLLLVLQKQYRRAAGAALVSAFSAFLYFYQFQKAPYSPEAKGGILQIIKGFMAFLGSFAEVFPVRSKTDVCVILGVILFLVAVSIVSATLFRVIRNKYEQPANRNTDLFLLGIMLFILGTALIVSVGRTGYSVEILMTSRYKIYSFLLLITAYLFIVIPIRGSFLSPYVSGVAFLSILFNIFAYHFYLVDAFNNRKFLVTSAFNWTYVSKDLNPFTDKTPAGALVQKPVMFYEKWLPLIPKAQSEGSAGNVGGIKQIAAQTVFSVMVKNDSTVIEVKNDTYRGQRLQDSGVYILLSSANRYYLYPGYRGSNRSKKDLFLRQQYFAPGFVSDIPFSELDPNKYALGMVLQKGDSTGIYMTGDSILVTKSKRVGVKTNW